MKLLEAGVIESSCLSEHPLVCWRENEMGMLDCVLTYAS